MFDQDSVKVENTLAFAMLKEASTNALIKKKLKCVAVKLASAVLSDLRAKLATVHQYRDLSPHYQSLIFNLAAEHTAERRQYGAAMFEVPSSSMVIDTVEHMHEFLNRLEAVIENTDKITSFEGMAIMLKTLVEFGYNYYEAPSDTHTADFDDINTYIGATPEELDIRLFRNELGEEQKLSISFGIGTQEQDLGLLSKGIGRTAGKSVFGMVNMAARLDYLCKMYDETGDKKYADKLSYYKIPLSISERQSIDIYAKRWETCFEKLMKKTNSGVPLPLIASVSRASTRLLVALQDVGVFNNPDGTFDFDTAQIISNCLMAFIVHAGHHSISEVAEVSNRLFDRAAIKILDSHSKRLFPYYDETTLPYYRFGDYSSFFHSSYAARVMRSLVEEKVDKESITHTSQPSKIN
jgi:hypothetical protein